MSNSDHCECDVVRKKLMQKLKDVIKLDKKYILDTIAHHKNYRDGIGEYSTVERLCIPICIIERMLSFSSDENVENFGELKLHVYAAYTFGIKSKEVYDTFKAVHNLRCIEIDDLVYDKQDFSVLEIDSDISWMIHFAGAIALKHKKTIQYLHSISMEYNMDEKRISDVVGAIKSVHWWSNMFMCANVLMEEKT
jgi:hypothetical protein